jgi:hypothetical protein
MLDSCCWSTFSFSVPYFASNNEVGLVHDSPKRDRQSISEFSSLMNSPRSLGIDMARKAAGGAEAGDESM